MRHFKLFQLTFHLTLPLIVIILISFHDKAFATKPVVRQSRLEKLRPKGPGRLNIAGNLAQEPAFESAPELDSIPVANPSASSDPSPIPVVTNPTPDPPPTDPSPPPSPLPSITPPSDVGTSSDTEEVEVIEEEPAEPEQPELPEQPDLPELPVPVQPVPEQPELPEQPDLPEQPEQPEQPEIPEQPEQPDEVTEVDDSFPIIQDIGQGYYPCHPEKGITNTNVTCTRVELPPNLCQRCPLRPITQNGQFHLCNNIFNTDLDSCKIAMQEYVQLNGHCDTKRAQAVPEWLAGDSFATKVVDYFLYSVCELCCDCIPMGVARDDYASLSNAHSPGTPTLWDAERGNCPAHAVYDLCKVLPNVEYVTQPNGPSQNLPPACPILQSWLQSGRSSQWETDPDTSIETNTKVFLDSALDALDCESPSIWNKCYIMEDLQNHIDLPGNGRSGFDAPEQEELTIDDIQQNTNTDSTTESVSNPMVNDDSTPATQTESSETDASETQTGPSTIENGAIPASNPQAISSTTENDMIAVPETGITQPSTENPMIPSSQIESTSPGTTESGDSSTETTQSGSEEANTSTQSSEMIAPDIGAFGSNETESTSKDSSTKKSCFPGNALVELQDGSFVSMTNLKIGDRVRVSDKTFSDVYMFSHRNPYSSDSYYIQLNVEDQSLTLTPGHYIYIKPKNAVSSITIVPAKDVRIGDKLQTGDNSWKSIRSVELVEEKGLFNPHTIDGNIIVNGIRTTTYTTAVESTTATAILTPIRALYYMSLVGEKVIGTFFVDGWTLPVQMSL